MRYMVNDRFIDGVVAFVEKGRRAEMSYMVRPGVPLVTYGNTYVFEGTKWKIIGTRKSEYNNQVINVDLELVQ